MKQKSTSIKSMLFFILMCLLLVGFTNNGVSSAGYKAPKPTKTPTPSRTSTPTRTPTRTPTSTRTPSLTPTITNTPLPTGTPFACSTWNLTSDFRVSPNQENPNRDSCNNLGVWKFMGSTDLTLNPANYFLLPNFANTSGRNSWSGGSNAGHISFNASGSTYTSGSITWPANTIDVHPGTAQMVVMAWQSPLTGFISITGWVDDNNPYMGNCNAQDGIRWYLDKNTTSLASGVIPNGGVQSFASGTGGAELNTVAVNTGDMIYLAIHPDNNYYCDDTGVDLVISVTNPPTDTPTPTATFTPSPTATQTVTPTITPTTQIRWYTGNSQTSSYAIKANISAPAQTPALVESGESSWVSLPALQCAQPDGCWIQTGWRYYIGIEYIWPIRYVEIAAPAGYIPPYHYGYQIWGDSVEYEVYWSSGTIWCAKINGDTKNCHDIGWGAPRQLFAWSEVHVNSQNELDTYFSNVSYMDAGGQWHLFNQSNWREDSPYIIDKTQPYEYHNYLP